MFDPAGFFSSTLRLASDGRSLGSSRRRVSLWRPAVKGSVSLVGLLEGFGVEPEVSRDGGMEFNLQVAGLADFDLSLEDGNGLVAQSSFRSMPI